jgi:nicotinamide riboside transporter PnuC
MVSFQKKCVSFLRCESLWTVALMIIIVLMFFVPYTMDLSMYTQMMVMGLLMAGFFFISLYIWSEQPYDEREEYQQLQMNRWGYISGGVSIIAIIVYQSFTGGVDTALPLILIIMLGIKLIMKLYYRLRDNGKL